MTQDNFQKWREDYIKKAAIILGEMGGFKGITKHAQSIEEIESERKSRELVREFVDEMQESNPVTVRDLKLEYLINKAVKLHVGIDTILAEYKRDKKDENKSVLSPVSDYDDDSEITHEMIRRAKDCPFEKLLNINKSGFAFCPFHNDRKTPNLKVFNDNIAHCFSCGWHGDTIKFVMDSNGWNFGKAVKSLIDIDTRD